MNLSSSESVSMCDLITVFIVADFTAVVICMVIAATKPFSHELTIFVAGFLVGFVIAILTLCVFSTNSYHVTHYNGVDKGRSGRLIPPSGSATASLAGGKSNA
jgi:uncharacterized membrane protein